MGYRPLEGATPQDELAALAAVYSLVLERFGRGRAVVGTGDQERSVGADAGEQPPVGDDN